MITSMHSNLWRLTPAHRAPLWVRLLAYLFILFAGMLLQRSCAHAQTLRSKSSMQAEISGNFPDNTVGAITPLAGRTTYGDMVQSYQQAPAVNNQTGTTYTVQLTDYGQVLIFNNSSGIAVTLQSASTAGWYPFSFYATNLGSGAVTITPTAGTIAGASSYSIAQNGSVLIVSDGTNWQIVGAAGTTGSGCTVSGVTTGYIYNNGASGCSTSTTLTTSAGIDTESGTLNISGTLKSGGNTMTFPGSAASLAALNVTDQTLAGGANVTTSSLGTLSSGTTTIDCGLRPLQVFINNGSFTLAAPTHDGSCALLMVNGASAHVPVFSGFTVGSNTGDTITTAANSDFLLSIIRINSVATYLVKALQ